MANSKDMNQIAASILRQVTTTTPRTGETPGARAKRAGSAWGGTTAFMALDIEERTRRAREAAHARWAKR